MDELKLKTGFIFVILLTGKCIMKKILFLLFLTMVTGICAQAQNTTDEALAAEYFNKGEFDKAAEIYKKLLDQKPDAAFYYDGYINSLIHGKDYSSAEKEVKKMIRRNKNNVIYQVDLVYIYKLEGEDRKSNSVYDDIIDHLQPAPDAIDATASAFMRRDAKEYALKTYLKARDLIKNENAFAEDIGGLYRQLGQYEPMINEYLKVLQNNPDAFEGIKEQIQELVMQDEPYEIFRKALLKKIQLQPENTDYSELLTWLFIQRHDFNAAFIQRKALDKRLHEGGRGLVELARIVASYGDYDLAAKIYESVLGQGLEAAYYIPARRGLLDLQYQKITQTSQYTPSDISSLIAAYKDFLKNYGMNRPESGTVTLHLAEIQALYANDPASAIALLRKYIDEPVVSPKEQAYAKLALGDYLLLTGESWEATLFYGQVEMAYQDDPLGHEAKFRNAQLSLYRGDFDWAKAQLDVLKSSTSELIANDAMQLALLIQDNLGLDSTKKPLQLYADADFLVYKNQFDKAIVKLDSINKLFPGNSLSDDVLMSRAEIAFKKRDYTGALNFYQQVYTQYGNDILADDALYQSARIEDRYLNDPTKARDLYEKLITQYPGSVYTVEARSRYRALRGDAL
jgi:tetratricopeptide (TPR) repeat protein